MKYMNALFSIVALMNAVVGSASQIDADCAIVRNFLPRSKNKYSGNCCNRREVECEGYNRVTKLYLFAQGLSGVLHDSIGNLTSLDYLDVGLNPGLTGLPESISQLKELRTLHASGSGLASLPDGIASLPKLRILLVNSNRLRYMPNGTWPALESIDLHDNNLSPRPTIQDLKSFAFTDCDIVNGILGTTGYCCSNPKTGATCENGRVITLDWHSKGLSGDLSSIGNLEKLETLNVGDNPNLKSLPDSLSQLKELKSLAVINCDLTSISDGIALLPKLEELYLNSNKLRYIPNGPWQALQTLEVGYNPHLTAFPDTIGTWTELRTLRAINSGLTSLSDEIGFLPNLEELDLYGNELISFPIGAWPALEILDLGFNPGLGKSVPTIQTLKRYNDCVIVNAILDTKGNCCSNPISGATCVDGAVTSLNWRSKGLSGELSSIIGNLTSLETLNIGNNPNLTTLPDSIGELKQLKSLNAAVCGLISLPNGLASLPNLEILYLYGNNLTAIPSGAWPKLQSLSLHFNSGLGSPLPTIQDLKSFTDCAIVNGILSTTGYCCSKSKTGSTCKNGRVINLDWYAKGLSGVLSDSIGNLDKLETLDVGNNPTLTALPWTIQKLKELKSLRAIGSGLRYIPNGVASLPNLVELNLYGNNLTSIPKGAWPKLVQSKLDLNANYRLGRPLPSVEDLRKKI